MRWSSERTRRTVTRRTPVCRSSLARLDVVRRAWLLFPLFCGVACAPLAPPPLAVPPSPSSLPTAQPARPLREETLPALAVPRVVITGITNTESADRQSLFVEGRLHNEGTAATQQLRVQVNALDGSGQVLTSTTVLPVPQVIPPGGSATFLVRFPNDPAIRRFQVEAEVR